MNQSAKSIIDVGAGSQSRAMNMHVILRPREENDAVVFNATVTDVRQLRSKAEPGVSELRERHPRLF